MNDDKTLTKRWWRGYKGEVYQVDAVKNEACGVNTMNWYAPHVGFLVEGLNIFETRELAVEKQRKWVEQQITDLTYNYHVELAVLESKLLSLNGDGVPNLSTEE